jgi:glycosyltransferase involved in cell wall biosynthesis
VLGTASAIKPRKRIEDFIRLIAALKRQGLPVLGMIAGGGRFADPAYFEMLKELLHKENVADSCRFTGNLDPVTPFFRAIDIAVNTAEMEILSISICEGMACGKPTIAYDVGGNPEAVGDPWCIARFEDLATLIDRAAELVRNKDLRLQKGAEAEQHVRTNFDAPILAARQAAIYEEVLGRPLPASGGKRIVQPAECCS